MEIKSGKAKDNSRRKGIPAQMKAQRRAEAEKRQAEYDKLTPKQKLARLDASGLRATNERARLKKQMGDKKWAIN